MSEEAHRADVPSPDRLTALWRRAKEHRIAQWTVGYVAVAYGIQHAVTLTSEAFKWPDAVIRISMLLLALGLPLAMTLAWYHGERINRRISAGEMAIVSVMLVGISFAFYLFIRPTADTASRAPAAQQASVAAARQAVAGTSGAISVAVLPFVNLSADKDQEFFSDGMTEEITAALAQIKGLHVVGRTSAFAFKGKNEDLRTIGKSLGATHLIEGSVRKAGNQLRITAQLIKAGDDSHLWAQNYDRELKDVFSVQEDIARAIAASLQEPLGLKQGETLVSRRTADTESYEDYLRARAMFRSRDIKNAIAVLERSVARDPNNAAAWGLLAEAYIFVPFYVRQATDIPAEQARGSMDSSLTRAELAARTAIRLNPKDASAYAALAGVEADRMKWNDADDFFRQALQLDPDDPDALHLTSLTLQAMGKIRQALEMRLRLRTLEPFVPIYNVNLGMTLLLSGRGDEAVPILEAVPNQGSVATVRDGYLAFAHASAGRFGKAADVVLSIPVDQIIVSQPVITEAAKLLREGPARIAAAQPSGTSLNPMVGFVFALRSAPVRALDALEFAIETNVANSPAFMTVWSPAFSEARKTERFKQLARKAGLVEYWRARGWPDLCHPTSGDDFECN